MFRAFARLLFLALLAAAGWLGWALFLPVHPPAGNTVVLLPSGSSSRTIANALEKAGVIRNSYAFLLLHYFRPTRTLKAGEYQFTSDANSVEVLNRIVRGDILRHTVVVPEGYTMFEIAQAVESAGLGRAADFLNIAQHDTALVRNIDPDAHSLEGYLFPDTYQFTRTQSMHDIVAAMVHQFQRQAVGIGLNKDVHRVVTLASIVEKETAVPDERPLVASVYENRLRQKIALAADPTVAYAAMLNGHYRGTIYQSDLQFDSPYNTYRYAGLPPGPIANPGVASLKAALQPAASNYLYFVAEGNGSGRHRFSSSYEQHQQNVAAYRRAVAQR
ncbi:MAG TPA: endolytic transglycosylase MltG [Candidatus Acidoferrales bacterium]|nr:endolytic transglycosylase MltG [Candidatus Acidoferrales bacterium]